MLVTLSEIWLSVLIGITAVVFCYDLIEENSPFEFYGKLLKKLPWWLANPLGDCVYCFTGQLAFWTFIFKGDYNIIRHIFFISLTIFFSHLFTKIFD